MRLLDRVKGALNWRPRKGERQHDGRHDVAVAEQLNRRGRRAVLRMNPELRHQRRAVFGRVDTLRGAWWTRAQDRAGWLH